MRVLSVWISDEFRRGEAARKATQAGNNKGNQGGKNALAGSTAGAEDGGDGPMGADELRPDNYRTRYLVQAGCTSIASDLETLQITRGQIIRVWSDSALWLQ